MRIIAAAEAEAAAVRRGRAEVVDGVAAEAVGGAVAEAEAAAVCRGQGGAGRVRSTASGIFFNFVLFSGCFRVFRAFRVTNG
jgi:hypothetical protein